MNELRKETIRSDSGSRHEIWQIISDFLTDVDYSLKKSNYPDIIVGKREKSKITANIQEKGVDIEYSSDPSVARDIEILKRLLEQARHGDEVILRHQDRVYMRLECYDKNQDKWHQKSELGELILTNKAFKLGKKHWRTKKTDWIFYCTIEDIQNVSIDRQSLEIQLPSWAVWPFKDTACSSIKIRTDNLNKFEQWEILLREKPEKDWNDLIGEESDTEVTEKKIKGIYTFNLDGSVGPTKVVGKKEIRKNKVIPDYPGLPDRIVEFSTTKKRVRNLKEKDNSGLIQKFMKKLLAEDVRKSIVTKCADYLIFLSEKIGKSFLKLNKNDIMTFFSELEEHNYPINTKMNLKIVTKRFYCFLEKKELVKDIKIPIRILTISGLKIDKFNPESEAAIKTTADILLKLLSTASDSDVLGFFSLIYNIGSVILGCSRNVRPLPEIFDLDDRNIPWSNIDHVILRRNKLGIRNLHIYFQDDTLPKSFDVERFDKSKLVSDLKDMAVRKGFTFTIEDRLYKEYSPKKAEQLQLIIPWPNIHCVTLRRNKHRNQYLTIYFQDDTLPKSFDVEHFSRDKLIGNLKDIAEKEDFTFTIGEIEDPKAVEPLIDALKDGNRDVQQAAAEALGEIGDPKAVEPLIEALKDGDEEIRRIAAKALGEIGDPKAVEPLIDALKDGNRDVQQAAAEALGEIGDPKAVEPLIEALRDKSWSVRGTAAKVLGEIGDPKAVEPLIEVLEDKIWAVRLFVARALGEIGDPKVVEPLIEVLEDEEFLVGEAAAESLFRMGICQ